MEGRNPQDELGKRIGENLRYYRLEKSISQGDMAYMLGIHRGSYNRIEKGERKISLVEGVLAAKILKIKLSRLVGKRRTKRSS